MTMYAGEVIRVTTNLKDFDADVLTNLNVSSVTVEIRLGTTVVIAATAMTWDTENQEWYYDWDTDSPSTASAGTYTAKCRAQGTAIDSWEFKKFRLVESTF